MSEEQLKTGVTLESEGRGTKESEGNSSHQSTHNTQNKGVAGSSGGVTECSWRMAQRVDTTQAWSDMNPYQESNNPLLRIKPVSTKSLIDSDYQ